VLLSQSFFDPYRVDTEQQQAQKQIEDAWQEIHASQKAKEIRELDRALDR
jgi:hypothetical protein